MILGCVSIQAWPSSSSRRVWAKRSGTKKSFRDRPCRIRKWKSRRPTKGLFTWLNARIAEEHVSKVMYPPFPCERSFESKGIIKGVITATMILRRKGGEKISWEDHFHRERESIHVQVIILMERFRSRCFFSRMIRKEFKSLWIF